jgi:hypothetical protein
MDVDLLIILPIVMLNHITSIYTTTSILKILPIIIKYNHIQSLLVYLKIQFKKMKKVKRIKVK